MNRPVLVRSFPGSSDNISYLRVLHSALWLSLLGFGLLHLVLSKSFAYQGA